MKLTVQSFCFAMLAIFLVSCSSNSENSIVGKWQKDGGTQAKVEFYKDGSVTAVAGSNQLSGKYEFLDENRLRIDYGGKVGAMIFKMSILENELVLTEPNGRISTFKRTE